MAGKFLSAFLQAYTNAAQLILLALTSILCLQEAPQGLQEVLKQTDATGRMRIIQQMSINIIPIVEKGLLDPVITHGWVQ